ncbi:MAG: SCO family protein [Ignavibacteria bacterium]|nr:SCO family protein [Ignavibacteria bacterium]
MKIITTKIVLLFTVLLLQASLYAQEKKPEVGIEEQLGKNIPMNLEFYDEDGYLVKLSDIVSKPTILNLVFYECRGICTPLLTELAENVNKIDLELGKDYQILTVSFDHTEKPQLAASKKINYIKLLEHPIKSGNWRFMTGDSLNVKTLTDAVGFYYKKEEDQFIHAGALIFISADGKITRYLLGIDFLPFNIKMATIEASEGKVGPTIAKLLKFCYAYDPEGRTYALNITRIIGVGIIFCVIAFAIFLTVKPKKSRNTEDKKI